MEFPKIMSGRFPKQSTKEIRVNFRIVGFNCLGIEPVGKFV
jgi:hypothetical protein